VFAVTVYNPLAAASRAEAERLFAEVFGRESSLLQSSSTGAWLRQDGADGSSVLTAGAVGNKGLSLTAVSIIQYDKTGRFAERIDGARASLKEGFWQVEDAWVVRSGAEPEQFSSYLVSTYLSPERVQDALGTAISISFWELPGLIEATEKAGLSAANFRMQYELLLSRPLLLIAMVFLGATVSLRSFRSGRIQTMIVTGMVAGLGFLLLLEVSRQIGISGLIAPRVAVWFPVIVAVLISSTVLLNQEDG
jgi:lipopolysaccharide export system permease protein